MPQIFEKTLVMILCGGKGERLYPLTRDRAMLFRTDGDKLRGEAWLCPRSAEEAKTIWEVLSTPGIASERSKRPDDFRPAQPEKKESTTPGFCPFCRGNEAKTPWEIFAVRDDGSAPDTPGWRVRVVAKKFPALTRGEMPRKKCQGIFEFMDGIGVHEVIIETPDHDREMGDLWYLEIFPVLTHVAGFEWGTGFYINPVPPESAVKFLRE